MTQTMRERLLKRVERLLVFDPAPAMTAREVVDAILEELRAEASAQRPDHEGVIYEMARAIGLADSGTDLESIASGRGSYVTYTECAKDAFTAMIDAIRGGKA